MDGMFYCAAAGRSYGPHACLSSQCEMSSSLGYYIWQLAIVLTFNNAPDTAHPHSLSRVPHVLSKPLGLCGANISHTYTHTHKQIRMKNTLVWHPPTFCGMLLPQDQLCGLVGVSAWQWGLHSSQTKTAIKCSLLMLAVEV